MDSDGAEIMKMARLAAWCLQADYNRRPSMPIVVKVLEGDLDVEENLNFDFSNMQAPSVARNAAAPSNRVTTTSLLPSILSGPR
ncbi:G-type lectin S-receptor-like serine/threonine-protein kinase SD2-5-like protein [Corchorus olitorius]|uniref:G-type lectin S-receptor-like serine/threonine-protein kinase SD2-5-like protein n=1 Tax=Corchorus olitorius TaxID=93759 RepID=A0A1R3GSD9_9ROSI|nr:G-type lectin S-receptor-like serine/threonine-protein kinase SD2-5-like protein [Corchorus olitorius]